MLCDRLAKTAPAEGKSASRSTRRKSTATISGTDDADQFLGGLGSDMIDGKMGVDTAFFESSAVEVSLKGNLAAGITVSIDDSGFIDRRHTV